jgi:hypothetical protein
MYGDDRRYLKQTPWYPPGGDDYLKVTSAKCNFNLLSMGVSVFDSLFGIICQEQSLLIQRNNTSHRPQTMNDWLQLILTHVMVVPSSNKFLRTNKVHSRFIGDYDNPSDRNEKLLPKLKIPSGEVPRAIVKTFGQFTPAKNTKTNRSPVPMEVPYSGLDEFWVDNVTEFLETGSSVKRLDQRIVCHNEGQNEPALPYQLTHPSLPSFCPGLTYNEWVAFFAALMPRIMTRAYNNKSRYIETCLAQNHKGATVEEVTWAYAVGATNKFMQEFQYKNGLFKPNWKIQYLRLFYLIASCCVQPNYFPELKMMQPIKIDATKMLKYLFSNSGIGSFSPKIEAGCLISNDKYAMGPLKLANKEIRDFAQFQVRTFAVFICQLLSKTQGDNLVFFCDSNESFVYHN